MQPFQHTIEAFGIRDRLGREEDGLDLERITDCVRLIAIAGANGSASDKSTMDNLVPLIGLPSGPVAQGRWLFRLRPRLPAQKRKGRNDSAQFPAQRDERDQPFVGAGNWPTA